MTPRTWPADGPTPWTASDVVRAGLDRAASSLEALGVPVPAREGKLLRPTVAYALVPPARRSTLDVRFWAGSLAVQMAHEASLVHDDILDDASERRGSSTLVAAEGVGPALVLGDHYLTGAYRAASETASFPFLVRFIRAVERTVAGEVAQGRSVGRRLSPDEYHRVVEAKSGELFGAAACLGGALLDLGRDAERLRFGRDVGALYQRVDDLLDYASGASTGKPPLQDYRQRKWTWVLDLAGVDSFEWDPDRVVEALFRPRPSGPSPARIALAELGRRRDELVRMVSELSPGDRLIADVLDDCVAAANAGVEAQEASDVIVEAHVTHAPARVSHEAEVAAIASALGGPDDWLSYFGRHARTFRFAARLFPPEPATRISGVYAYCRFTDDLVDEPGDGDTDAELVERLAVWSALSRAAFDGHATGVPLLDVVLREAGAHGVSWRYVEALLDGVGMDLVRTRYPHWTALEEYTFGVAGSVGGWITQLFGFHDRSLLEHAYALGHGMQLTNIVRDVGEDLDRGRVYLPESLLSAHGLDVVDLVELRLAGPPLGDAYRALVEELIGRADSWYDRAWPGIRELPAWYRRPVAVAAQAYRGIHDAVRRNGYDNLTRRASTSLVTKAALGAVGLAQSAWRPVWPVRPRRAQAQEEPT